jgi:hypothetical protein
MAEPDDDRRPVRAVACCRISRWHCRQPNREDSPQSLLAGDFDGAIHTLNDFVLTRQPETILANESTGNAGAVEALENGSASLGQSNISSGSPDFGSSPNCSTFASTLQPRGHVANLRLRQLSHEANPFVSSREERHDGRRESHAATVECAGGGRFVRQTSGRPIGAAA